MSEGKRQQDDHDLLMHHTFVLLDHLERQSDNRLQAQFDDMRHKLSVSSPKMAVPPCDKYGEFLATLAHMEKNSSGTLNQKDEQFLRWSRDFLAVVAHPATVETISITREYIKTRTERALMGWRAWLRPWGGSMRARQTCVAIEAEGFKDSARYLARIVQWVQRLAIAVTAIALLFSGHAMVGRLIITQEKDALEKFQELTKSADANRIALFRVTGAEALIKPTYPDHGCPAGYRDVEQAEGQHDEILLIPINGEQQQAGSAQTLGTANPSIAAQEAAWSLLAQCRSVQWALMQLVAENIRLKSWDEVYIDIFRSLIGWDESTIRQVGSVLDDGFCTQIAAAYHENTRMGCTTILSLLVRDSASVANSVLGWLTMYILPCLYAFIGAAAAVMISIRRKTDVSLLCYSDGVRIKQALILGFVFGGVIGLFAGYLSKPLESNGLGLSALALLAGYNVPAVSELLEDLSKRIFRPGERDAQAARSA
jgi:hypothetical protein